VHVSYFDTNETLETKLLRATAASTWCADRVLFRETDQSRGYLAFDKSKLPT